jgi:hypothetical protein
MGHAEKMIDKLEYVFSVFEKHDDAALLWRPHPLSIQTAKSMSPYILDRYMALIERFKRLPNGVYDDTADVHRAIAVSDAYIGDHSSLVAMYGVTGKPMLMMSAPEIYTDDLLDYITVFGGVHKDGVIYVFSSEYNALFRVKDNNAEFLCSFDKLPHNQALLFADIIAHEDELIFIPHYSDYIVVYNTQSGQAEYYKTDINAKLKFICPIRYKDSIYLPVCNEDCIVRFDLNTKQQKYIRNVLGSDGSSYETVFRNAVRHNNYMLVPCREVNKLLIWDMDSDTGTVKDIPKISCGCTDIAVNGDDIYLLSYPEKDIWRWNYKTNETVCILKNTYAYRIHSHNNKLFVIPEKAENICVFNIDANKLEQLKYPKDFRFLRSGTKYLNYELSGNIMCLYPLNANMYLELDMDKCEFREERWNADNVVRSAEFKAEHIISDNYTYTDRKCRIDEFITLVRSDNYKEKRRECLCRYISNHDGTAGQKIWEYIYKRLNM